jgi:hypothetical protein
VTFMGGTNNSVGAITTATIMPELKRKREDSEDIPTPSLRGGGEMPWRGAAAGANAVQVKRWKFEAS